MRVLRATLPLLLLFAVLAGCLSGGGHGGDQAIHWPTSAYYNVEPVATTYLERSARHLGGGPTSGSLHYHTLDEVESHLHAMEADHPGLVELRTIGESRLGRPLWDVVITDKSVPAAGKLVPILDGAHHGNEYAGGELMLYAADTLLENHATNHTVQRLLRDLEIHVVPVVNPDGWVAATRYNGFGVNLNRNYDLDWGDPAGTSNPVMGTVGAAAGQPLGGVALVAENCGAAAFSEPETQAMKALFEATANRSAFYLTGHTATHAVIAPWAAFQSPGPLPAEHSAVLEQELQWVRDHTEYQAGKAAWGNFSAGLPYAASGSSMDYYYETVHKPAFTIEVEYEVTSATSTDYPARLTQPFQGLQFWMQASAGLPLHLLANAKALADWEPATAPPLTPDGKDAALPDWLAPAVGQPHL
jgi:hypothetical protein